LTDTEGHEARLASLKLLERREAESHRAAVRQGKALKPMTRTNLARAHARTAPAVMRGFDKGKDEGS
jgi:hypothetical protein